MLLLLPAAMVMTVLAAVGNDSLFEVRGITFTLVEASRPDTQPLVPC